MNPLRSPRFQTPHLDSLLYLSLFAATVCAVSLLMAPGFQDSDSQWHIAAGLDILKTGQIPQIDPWAIQPEQTWYNLSWLYDVIIAVPSYYFGDRGLLILWLCLSGVLVAETFRVLKAWVPCPQTRLLTTLLCSAALINSLALRPQSIAGLLALYTLVVLHQSRANSKKLYWLPLISLFWANLHGSLPLFFLFIGVFFIESLLKKNLRLGVHLVFWGTLSGVTCLLNPLGLDIFVGMQRTTHSCISPFITEWQKWSLSDRVSDDVFLAGLLLLTFLPPNKSQLSERILTLVLLFLAFNSIRFFALLAIVAAPVIAQQLSQLPKLPRFLTGPTLCLSLFAGLFFLHHFQKPIYHILAQNSLKYSLLEQAITHLLDNHQGKNVLNTYEVGGALIHLGGGKFQHYIDGRAGTAFSEDRLEEYLDLLKGQIPVEQIIKKYEIDVAFLSKDSPLHQNLLKVFVKAGWNPELINHAYVILVPPSSTLTSPTPTPPPQAPSL